MVATRIGGRSVESGRRWEGPDESSLWSDEGASDWYPGWSRVVVGICEGEIGGCRMTPPCGPPTR